MAAPISVFNADQTASLLGFAELVAAIATAAHDYTNGLIQAPERQVVPFPNGGVMLSMPATAQDIGTHKLVNVVAQNRAKGIPVISGVVSAFDGETGQPLFVLDGPTVTARRTAAVSMLGIKTFLKSPPRRIALIGTGAQALGHIQALASLFPQVDVIVVGGTLEKAQGFVSSLKGLPLFAQASVGVPDDVDVVITLTTSQTPVYTRAAQTGCLVVGVGAYKPDLAEIAPLTLRGSHIYVDDPAGARHEAGDLIQAKTDWNQVGSLAQALAQGVNFETPLVFKTVGCAAWDLAAARCARDKLAR